MHISPSLDLIKAVGVSTQVVTYQGVTYYRISESVFRWCNGRIEKLKTAYKAKKIDLDIAKSMTVKWEQCKLCMTKQSIDYSGWLSENNLKVSAELPKEFAVHVNPTCVSFIDLDEFHEQAVKAAATFFPDDPPGLPDDVLELMGERAADVNFDDSPVVMRESYIIREPGWPVMVLSKEFVESIVEWNKMAAEKHRKKQYMESDGEQVKPRGRAKKKSAPGQITLNDGESDSRGSAL